MAFNISGKLHKKFEIESKTANFQTREFVIQSQEQYPQMIKFQLTQDRCSIVDNFNEGDVINVFFDLKGREWNDKYFTNLQAWKIEKEGDSSSPAGESLVNQDESSGQFSKSSDSFDDLPF
ncbi:MAG: DUF3127 domain-containing protein [Saprospiraceae bacterium]|nr:DUF3127 domain-containing protein [Saprospiraceae bacterium]